MDRCPACGHVRYVLAGDSFNGSCENCCVWVERQMINKSKEIAALKAELARYTGPLTAEEEFAMWDKWQVADEDNHPVLFLDRAMAAIRAAREGAGK